MFKYMLEFITDVIIPTLVIGIFAIGLGVVVQALLIIVNNK